MEDEIMTNEKSTLTMKLLHYFITEKNYNPIILQGIENEIWLENLDEDCKVVRIVSNYIHNNEQLDFDIFKTKRIVNKIKKKTLIFKMNVLTIFLDLGENVDKEKLSGKNFFYVNAQTEEDIVKNKLLESVFPELNKKIKCEEKGEALFMKITKEINIHNQEDARKTENIFRIKYPTVTYILIALNIIFWAVPYVLGDSKEALKYFALNATLVRSGQFYRLLTSMFYHINIFHLLINCYSLYIAGTQMESFLGKVKFTFIYFISGICGGLLSMLFLGRYNISIGASGAIFGILGSMLYFGYHYRVYLGNVLRTQIIPVVLFNLAAGFILPNIDSAAHIGGLIGGTLLTMAVGVDNKSTNSEKINGIILSLIYIAFIIYMAFIYTA